jgi:hypothetical protein
MPDEVVTAKGGAAFLEAKTVFTESTRSGGAMFRDAG